MSTSNQGQSPTGSEPHEAIQIQISKLDRAVRDFHYLVDKVEKGDVPHKEENAVENASVSLSGFLSETSGRLDSLEDRFRDATVRLHTLRFPVHRK